MLTVRKSGAEIAVFSFQSVLTNALRLKRKRINTETHSGCIGFSPQDRSRVRHRLLE